jgi:putative kinase
LTSSLIEHLKAAHLTLDQTTAPLLFDEDQIETFYLPVSKKLLQLAENHPRILIAIAGPPGCGKSSFSSLLAAILNIEGGNENAVVIGLDGWHYPNTYLDQHTALIHGREVSLRSIKGAHQSFDANAAFAWLSSVRQGATGAYPVYSRVQHDPLPDAGVITPRHRVILIEGNYLLLNIPPWQQFNALFDYRIFLTASRDVLEKAVWQRHLRGGKDPAIIRAHVDAVDLPNIELVCTHSSPADLTVTKSDILTIASID